VTIEVHRDNPFQRLAIRRSRDSCWLADSFGVAGIAGNHIFACRELALASSHSRPGEVAQAISKYLKEQIYIECCLTSCQAVGDPD